MFSSYSDPLSIGEAFEAGLKFVNTATGDEIEYYVGYHLFGDPSLTIRFPEGPLLTTPFSYIVTNMGSTLTIPFTIKNVGPTQATFAIEAGTDWEFPLTLSPDVSSITLAPGETAVIRVSNHILPPYEIRLSDTIHFIASQIDPLNELLTAKVDVTFQIFEPSVFLPIINR